MRENGFEDRWKTLLEAARRARLNFESACGEEAKHAEKAMYAANTEVRRFIELERNISTTSTVPNGDGTTKDGK